MRHRRYVSAFLVALWTASGLAADPATADASAERGRIIFQRKGTDWSCTSCHGADPREAGRHAVTGKTIEPMAPAVNPKRLSDPKKVAKWFRRNCRDVLERECTAGEQADVIAYLRSLTREDRP
jgi:mono/diheme cytochrome c family protein